MPHKPEPLFEQEEKLVKKLETLLKPIVKPIARQRWAEILGFVPVDQAGFILAETDLILRTLIAWWVRSLCRCADIGPKDCAWNAQLSENLRLPLGFDDLSAERYKYLQQTTAGLIITMDDIMKIMQQMGHKLPRKLRIREDVYVERLRDSALLYLECEPAKRTP